MKRKEGISLIVLIITIIIVVILATAVILSIANNNPIENAKKAAFLSDLATMQDELFIYLHQKEVENLGEYDKELLSADKYSLVENGEEQPGKNIKTIITSMSDKYLGKIEIINGKLRYTDTSNMQEYNWAKESFEGVSSNLEKAENTNSTIEISNATEGKLESLKIYGNSVANESTGNKVKNLFNMMDAVNGSDILDNGDGTITVTAYPAFVKKLSILAPDLKVGDEIVFSIKTNGYAAMYLNNISASFNKYLSNGGKYTITQEMLDSVVYLYRQTGAQGGGNAIISGIQIEYGDTATDYEAYDKEHVGKYKIPVTVSGKNLFDINSVELTQNCEIVDNGIQFTGNGSFDIPLPAGKYTISFDNNGVALCYIRNGKVDTGYITAINKTDTKKTFDYTADYDGYLRISSFGSGQMLSNIQIEEGETPTEYEPYYNKTYNIYLDEPLRKLEEAVDYIDFKQSKVVRNVKEENGVLSKLETSKIESVNLPEVLIKSGTNIITIGTSVTPSNIEVIYNKEK